MRYLGLPPARGQVARANDTKLFRALVLLALREKELGLDAAQHLKQAALLVPRDDYAGSRPRAAEVGRAGAGQPVRTAARRSPRPSGPASFP